MPTTHRFRWVRSASGQRPCPCRPEHWRPEQWRPERWRPEQWRPSPGRRRRRPAGPRADPVAGRRGRRQRSTGPDARGEPEPDLAVGQRGRTPRDPGRARADRPRTCPGPGSPGLGRAGRDLVADQPQRAPGRRQPRCRSSPPGESDRCWTSWTPGRGAARPEPVLVYRVFPYSPTARPGEPGHPGYEHRPQRGGRIDDPDHYVWYLTRQPERRDPGLGPAHPRRARSSDRRPVQLAGRAVVVLPPPELAHPRQLGHADTRRGARPGPTPPRRPGSRRGTAPSPALTLEHPAGRSRWWPQRPAFSRGARPINSSRACTGTTRPSTSRPSSAIPRRP